MATISTHRVSTALPAIASRHAAAYSSLAIVIGTAGGALSASSANTAMRFFLIPAVLLTFAASGTMQVQSYSALRRSHSVGPIAACAGVTLLSVLTIGTAPLSAPVTCSILAVATALMGVMYVLQFPAAAPSA